MGIWSWLFPSDEDRLRRARAKMAAGRFEDARKDLVHCHHPDAEKLYDECSAAVDKSERATLKKRLAGDGFHGWKVDADVKNARLKKELEGLVTDELTKAGVDLDMPEIDEKAFKAAVTRAQRRVKSASREVGAIRLVPIVDGKLASEIEKRQRPARSSS